MSFCDTESAEFVYHEVTQGRSIISIYYVPARNRTQITFGRGPGPLKGPESSMVVLMLSGAIWVLFLSILIKQKLINIVDQILGGAHLSPPPPPLPPDPPALFFS